VERALLVLVMAVAIGRAATVSVCQSKVVGPNGDLASGDIKITATSAFRATDGSWVEQVQYVKHLVNGAFCVALEPNVGDTAYRVKWQLGGAAPRDEFWVVPGSGPVGVCAVQAVRVSGVWAVAGCGGGGAIQWSTLTGSGWAALTVGGWGGLVP
jgi:hypothetical protein